MKPAALFSSFLVLIGSLCSCQKDIPDYVNGGGDSTSTSNSFLVKTYTEDLYAINAPDQHVKDSFGLSYDNNGRLLSMVSLDSANGPKFIYAYSNNSFTEDEYDNNQISLHSTVYLNSSSYIDSVLEYDIEGDTSTQKYFYDGNRQIITLKEYDYTTATGSVLTGTTTYEYDNTSDLLKVTSDTNVVTYTYPNKIINSLNMGLNYYKQGMYLPDNVTETSGTGSFTETGVHTYTFDSQKRLIMDKATTDNGYIGIKRYYY